MTSDPAPIVRPAPDPERDARVARRRAVDARRAGQALDALLAPRVFRVDDRSHAYHLQDPGYPMAWCEQCQSGN